MSEHQTENSVSSSIQSIPILPFAVQLQNIFPVEIVAKRFPVDMTSIAVSSANTQLNLGDVATFIILA